MGGAYSSHNALMWLLVGVHVGDTFLRGKLVPWGDVCHSNISVLRGWGLSNLRLKCPRSCSAMLTGLSVTDAGALHASQVALPVSVQPLV